MNQVSVQFNNIVGPVRPMHAVNNGPVHKFGTDQQISNLAAYKAAGIPYARTHDASFCHAYGGEHTVDVHAIFPDFDKDPYDPASYDFPITDEYMRVINAADTEVFYRLGSKIEHEIKKYGTLPPKDFHKWAIVCEHIIRHYTEGWADGFRYKMTYWEIWNEPDLDPDDSTHKRCWGGNKLQFFQLYHIAATHLKQCFPHLKIGGPALAFDLKWAEDFLAQLKAPLDFFSWHIYDCTVEKFVKRANTVRAMLDRYGFTETESILNEWNYVKGWEGDEWIYSLRCEKGLKGASFIAANMCEAQKGSVDMLMYYDARPTSMNGMFNTDFVCDTLKGYYPFKMFNTLYRLGQEAESAAGDHIHAVAAVNGRDAALMLTHYDDDDTAAARDVRIDLTGFNSKNGVRARWYILDKDHDMALRKEELYSGDAFTAFVTIENFTTLLVTLEKL